MECFNSLNDLHLLYRRPQLENVCGLWLYVPHDRLITYHRDASLHANSRLCRLVVLMGRHAEDR
jgi:hypothetical protein